MPSSYSRLLYHCVFGTKERRPVIHAAVADELYPFMASILTPDQGRVLKVGGTKDHVHLLVQLPTDVSVADAIRAVKANSSRWLNRRGLVDGPFRWQAGFAAFSVSYSAREAVERYITGQAGHHERGGFAEELAELLKRHGLQYDERFLGE